MHYGINYDDMTRMIMTIQRYDNGDDDDYGCYDDDDDDDDNGFCQLLSLWTKSFLALSVLSVFHSLHVLSAFLALSVLHSLHVL